MFVELEPVREDSEQEQENGKAEQHQSRHDTCGIPNLSSGRCHEAMERQAKYKEQKETSTERHIPGQPQIKGNVHFPSVTSKFNESECRKT